MGRKKEVVEEPAGPTQNKAIIFGICLCQLALVLSIVSFIYLSVAIYMPSHRAFNSGFETEPVTCETTELKMAINCSWASCGEWCLTKTSGFCPQITVRVRRNSTDIVLENCSRLSTNSCPQVNPESFKKFNCNNGSECSTLTGLFNCSLGHCANMTEQLLCHYKADGITIDAEADNNKLTGYFECYKSKCTKIKKYFGCERKYCPKVTTTGVNTFLMYEESVYTADCQGAFASFKSNGSSPGIPIHKTKIWNETDNQGFLLTYCHKVEKLDNQTLLGRDCVNGTVIKEADMPTPYMNFTTLWSVFDKSNQILDPQQEFLPMTKQITIYDNVKLFINLDGCVNTLRGECKEFTALYGKDGHNRTAVSRFPCFYNKNNGAMAVTRYDLEKTRRELLVALVVPSVLFALSFTTLMIVTRSVKVDDDSILRCRLCASGADIEASKEEEEETLRAKNQHEQLSD